MTKPIVGPRTTAALENRMKEIKAYVQSLRSSAMWNMRSTFAPEWKVTRLYRRPYETASPVTRMGMPPALQRNAVKRRNR